MNSTVTTFYGKNDTLQAGTKLSESVRAVALTFDNPQLPIRVQFRGGRVVYAYGVNHLRTQAGEPLESKQDLLDFYNMLVNGGYTVAQLKAGIPGKRSSVGALVSSMLVKPTKESGQYLSLQSLLVSVEE